MKTNEMKNALGTIIAEAIKNCSNHVKLEDMIKLESFETRNLTEELNEKRKEVAELEATIAECEAAKAKQEAEEKFLSSLSNSMLNGIQE